MGKNHSEPMLGTDSNGILGRAQETQAEVEGDKLTGIQEEKPKKRRYVRRVGKNGKFTRTEIAKILDQHARGLSRRQIAQEIKCADHSIQRVLDTFKPLFRTLEKVRDYQKVKPDLIDSAQLVALQSMVSDQKQEGATIGELAKMFDVLYKANRLERGQSTANITSIQFQQSVQPERSDLGD